MPRVSFHVLNGSAVMAEKGVILIDLDGGIHSTG